MKTGVGRLVVAIVLFAAGAGGWAEARLTRRVADAHQRFATFRYAADDGIDEAANSIGGLTGRVSVLLGEVRRLRTNVAYWRAQHEASTELAASSTAPASSAAGNDDDPRSGDATEADLMFAAANSAFRESQHQIGERRLVVERLDNVLQAYAEVIRADSANADAAFNYEFVARYRDTVARGRGPIRASDREPRNEETGLSVDLPAGSTIHGRPGAPPPELRGEEFKTLVPMPAEEVPEDPGEGTPRRRG